MPYITRTVFPYGFSEGHGTDHVIALDEDGNETRLPVKASEEERHQSEVDGYRRDLEGANARIEELETLAKSPERFGRVEEWIIAAAHERRANAIRELKRLAAIDKPTTTKGKRK
jgi:hypothetical protein